LRLKDNPPRIISSGRLPVLRNQLDLHSALQHSIFLWENASYWLETMFLLTFFLVIIFGMLLDKKNAEFLY